MPDERRAVLAEGTHAVLLRFGPAEQTFSLFGL
jgi:hypothetical protein